MEEKLQLMLQDYQQQLANEQFKRAVAEADRTLLQRELDELKAQLPKGEPGDPGTSE